MAHLARCSAGVMVLRVWFGEPSIGAGLKIPEQNSYFVFIHHDRERIIDLLDLTKTPPTKTTTTTTTTTTTETRSAKLGKALWCSVSISFSL
jgi:hypothetical protein